MPVILEYIWIGGNGELRTKTRVVDSVNDITSWNYDGSSTGQASSYKNTEVILKPVKMYKNPFINKWVSQLVLCETYDIDGNPLPTNHRHDATHIFNKKPEEICWFGLEQEYFMIRSEPHMSKMSAWHIDTESQDKYYCGIGNKSSIERAIAQEHLVTCLDIGLTISGINAEVANKQWEFQIGPCEGIAAADQLYIARYLLERIAEKYEVTISYKPKLLKDINGSGCHTNFSTKTMREPNGIAEILKCMNKLKERHDEHMEVYGQNNESRLTGHHETAPYNKFSYGVGTRNTSIRIGNETYNNGMGYFEDRRPASNMDPYLVTSRIFKTCCLNE
jgi:glutamine synthetase